MNAYWKDVRCPVPAEGEAAGEVFVDHWVCWCDPVAVFVPVGE